MEVITDDFAAEIKEWLRDYIDNKCIYRVESGQKRLKGLPEGTEYNWQIYLRRGLFNPKFLNIVGILFWKMHWEEYQNTPFQVTGLETGSTPLLCSIAMTAPLFDINDINVFSTRAKRKTYGLFNRFEGIVDYNLPVLIVDDLSNSKATMKLCKTYCEQEELILHENAFTVINKDLYNIHPDTDKYIEGQIKVRSIFTLDDLHMTWNKYDEYCKKTNKEKLAWRFEKHVY